MGPADPGSIRGSEQTHAPTTGDAGHAGITGASPAPERARISEGCSGAAPPECREGAGRPTVGARGPGRHRAGRYVVQGGDPNPRGRGPWALDGYPPATHAAC